MHNSVLLVIHQPTSDPGLVGELLQETGYSLDIRCPADGDRLPDTLANHRAAVIFGGPMSANDDNTLPFIKEELDWIPTVLEANKPFLGICLGAQMLARVLGATVTPHPDEQMEIGYFPLYHADQSQVGFDLPSYVYHWHGEGFEIPRSATLLARGNTFPNQAFRYGDRTYGLQFHPEMTLQMIDRWTTEAAEHLVRPGAQGRDIQMQQHEQHGPAVRQWLSLFLEQWLADHDAL